MKLYLEESWIEDDDAIAGSTGTLSGDCSG
jgi:hypothetical protein